ncbi:carboxypeptidase regulatory-like domain-containing protein [Roseiconus nitratireducens]|uniref:Carboxypeptidase regulatory-like domain-containing protein n=1 Tax=Roseiconus nitratireducens TaxID=2605748 RepID=A0A5M6DAR2_9BACT|nr:carboxypeptidase-like regulatory domain-containing protein [Roseiconus nitratireducens]KAA5543616.1 carboxypeptidase regulatory-like domain-containing protein [Roseiconus nitratireducens]
MKGLTCGLATLAMLVSATIVSAQDVTLHQWVRSSADGTVTGNVVIARDYSVSSLGDAQVSLMTLDGKEASAPVSTDKDGKFVLSDVQPGVYNVMVRGDQAFACCALHVVMPSVPVANSFEIAAGSIDYSVVRGAMIRYQPAGKPAAIEFDPTKAPEAAPEAPLEAVRVAQFDGGMKGRLTRAGQAKNRGAANSNVIIFQDDIEVARTTTDAEGYFNIDELELGSYSVLGLGRDGVGLLGLELVDPAALQTAGKLAERSLVVNQGAACCDSFSMQVAPLPAGGSMVQDVVVSEQIIDGGVPIDGYTSPLGGGSMGGYAGGGYGAGGAGGGIGGGGGLGGIAALGGIGAAIAIAASDDDNAVVTPPPASPASPVVASEESDN